MINLWDTHCIELKVKRPWIGTYEINKISLSRFDDKIYIQNDVYDGLDLGYQSWLEKCSDVNNYFIKKLVSIFNFQSNQWISCHFDTWYSWNIFVNSSHFFLVRFFGTFVSKYIFKAIWYIKSWTQIMK